MKNLYFLLLTLISLSFVSCKQEETRERKISLSAALQNREKDQKRLDEKLAFTERIWDSLATILSRNDLEAKYRDSVQKLYVQNKNEQQEINKEFIGENPNSVVSIEVLNGFKFQWGKETIKRLFDSLHPELQDSEEGEQVKKYLTFFNDPQVDDSYSDFQLPDLNGNNVKISENRKDYTLLEFWASWCIYCRKKHPKLVEVYEKYKDRHFTVIGISGDRSEADWRTAVDQDNLPWINLIDTNGRESLVQYQYGISKLPTNFLIGPDGNIMAIDITPEELDEVLKNLK